MPITIAAELNRSDTKAEATVPLPGMTILRMKQIKPQLLGHF